MEPSWMFGVEPFEEGGVIMDGGGMEDCPELVQRNLVLEEGGFGGQLGSDLLLVEGRNGIEEPF
jgi:hypothetical protein